MRDSERDDGRRGDEGAVADATLVAAGWDGLSMARGDAKNEKGDEVESGDSDVVLEGEDADGDDLDEDDLDADDEEDDDDLDEDDDEDDEAE